MTLRLFDSATRAVRDFVPLVEGRVGIYLCGATVQAPPHVGHVRSSIAFDVLVRWLRRSGHQVTMIRNVTDIDDKILAKAADAGVPWWAWAIANERAFTAAYDALGVLPPDYEPRATGHVPAMVELMTRLVESGHAYATGPGDVYFDVRSYPAYGALSNQRLDDIVEFAPLTREQLGAIVELQVTLVSRRLAERGIAIELTDEARTLLGNLGYDPTYGARPLKRVIQKRLIDPLALALLEGRFVAGDTVRVGASEGELAFQRVAVEDTAAVA